MNVKIGFPMDYWQHGGWALRGYVAVILLVGIAVVVMLATRKRETGGPLFTTISLLVGAGIVLQFLPKVEMGFLFIPVSPWSYSGWLPFLLSLVSWASLVIATLVVLDRALDGPAVVSYFVLFSMAINGLLSFVSTNASAADPRPVAQTKPMTETAETPMDRHREQMDGWREKKTGMEATLRRLNSDREEVADQLRNAKATVRSELANELRDLDRQIDHVRREADLLNSAIIGTESRLRRLERQRLVGGSGVVTDREFREISESLGELHEEVRAADR